METKPKATPLAVFLSKSGYRSSDISGHNDVTRVFATWNGGKYQLNRGGNIRVLKGPPYPKFVPEV